MGTDRNRQRIGEIMSSTGVTRIEGVDPAVAIKAPCTVATTANITLSGAQTIDGVAVAETTVPTRVLVRAQTDSSENGIYNVSGTAWSRSEDFDGNRDVVKGSLVVATQGTVYSGTTFKITTADPIVINTSDIDFVAANPIDTVTVVGTAGIDTYAKMRALSSGAFSAGDVIKCTGDGIAGDFKIVDGTVTDNGGTLIVFTDDINRYAERINTSNAINVLWFGVTEAAASNTTIYNTIVAAGYKYIYFPDGTFMGSFNLGNNQVLQGSTAKNGTVLIPPAGGSHVIKIDATSSAKQHCQVLNISLRNPNAVANCDGLVFDGADKNDINDQHAINNMFIKDFRYGISVTGRQILCTYRNIEIEECTIGMNVVSDPANYAYNLNTFISCKFATCTAQGIKITGFNVANKFLSCNIEGNNTDQVAGVAGMDVENAEGLFLDNPYFELNGASMAVDTGTATNNSAGLKLTGSRCFNLMVTGGWMVQSGIVIWIANGVTCWGGKISGIRLLPETGGWTVYCDGAGVVDRPSLCLDTDNYFNGQVEIVEQGTGQYGAHTRQSSGTFYITSAQTLDLLASSKYTCNNASGFTLTTISNRIPGNEFWVHNRGAGNITIDSALMASGVNTVITQGEAKAFMVAGFPDAGELVPVTGQSEHRTGSGSPSGSVTPTYIGEEWLDTTGNAWYKSYGLANTNWQAL